MLPSRKARLAFMKVITSLSISVSLVLTSTLVAYAEARTTSLPGSITGEGKTWRYTDSYGNTIADAYTKSTSSVYFQDVTSRSYSVDGGIHKIDEHYGSVYNGTYVEDVGGNLISAYVTTRHYWRMSPYGGDYQIYTSDTGNQSTANCYQGQSPCSPYI